MNASYKIVLLGAFVVFAAVVGYVIFSGGDEADANLLNDEYAQQDPAAEPDSQPPASDPGPEPEPRPVIEEPPAPLEPVVEEETIGETPDELPEAPLIAELPPDEDTLIRELLGDPLEPELGEADPITEEAADPDELTRPGPGSETEEPTEDPIEAEPEAEPIRPVPPAPDSIPRTYTVKEGDLLSTIALEFYGEERAWFAIAQANPTVDPKRLQIGQVIVLPNLDEEVREREEVQPPAPGQDQNYTVRPGDNLSKIAKRFYGDSEKWDLIYARNRKLIGPRPNDLKVGMELVIPQPYEGAE